MREIDGYLLTDEEAKACLKLIKQMRKKYFADCTCHLKMKAKDSETACIIVNDWIIDVKNFTEENWSNIILDLDINVEDEGVEE